MKNYDALLIFLTSLKEEDTEKALAGIRKEIERLGGEPGTSRFMGKRTFARTLKKQEEGLYYRLTFGLPPEQVEKLMGRFKLNADLFRVQVECAAAVVAPAAKAPPAPADTEVVAAATAEPLDADAAESDVEVAHG